MLRLGKKEGARSPGADVGKGGCMVNEVEGHEDEAKAAVEPLDVFPGENLRADGRRGRGG